MLFNKKITSLLIVLRLASLLMEGTNSSPTPSTPEQMHELAPVELRASGAASVITQRGLDALASMVIATLPFPPLPLMVSQGTDAESATASSFDLLKQAIILQKMIGTHRPAEQIAEGKHAQLRALQQEMLQHCSSEKSVDSDDWLDAAYLIYCKHFRSYFVENYATCSRDLRFEPMASVAASHVIMQQAASHVTASLIMAGEESRNLSFARYSDVVRHYAEDLGTATDS
jgi:hypothetical protein